MDEKTKKAIKKLNGAIKRTQLVTILLSLIVIIEALLIYLG